MENNSIEDKIFKYGKDITWSLPILFQYEPVWGGIVKICKNYGIELPRVNGFGCPAMAWTGGRVPNLTGELDPRFLLKLFEYCEEMKITPSFTFTYTQLTKEDLKDRYCNYILDMALEVGAHFIIYSDLLKNHIKEKDPNAYLVSSIIKPINLFHKKEIEEFILEKETEFYNDALKKYDLVVVRPEYSKDILINKPNLISDISRIEVLINQECIPNCPLAPMHYDFFGKTRNGKSQAFHCIKKSIDNKDELYKSTMAYTRETTQKLVDLGVKHLKIQGRGVGNTNEAHALLMFTQMFETEGYNYMIFTDIIHQKVNDEVKRFINEINGLYA